MSSGQYWPELCRGGPTQGLEGLLRIRGDDGQGGIPEVLKKSPKKYNNLKVRKSAKKVLKKSSNENSSKMCQKMLKS